MNKEIFSNYYKLESIKETQKLNAVWDPELDPKTE